MHPLHAIVWSAAEWVDVLASLPVSDALPARTLLVPSTEAGHAIRAALVRAQRPDLLAGLQILTPHTAALATLARAGIACDADEDRVRAARVAWIAQQDRLTLTTLPSALLASGRGWDEAVATAIGDCEAACLTPAALRDSGMARLADFATVWEACDEAAGTSWTRARVLREAAAVLQRDAGEWPFDGPVLAIAAGDETAAGAAFVQAIPEARLVALPARPLHPRSLERWDALWGGAARAAIEASAAAWAEVDATPLSERDRLARWLFAPLDAVLGERAASAGADGSLSLEAHAGVEDECAAAIEWVAREVLDHATPVARVALLLPALDPVATVLVQRLAELPWGAAGAPAYVAGGVPLSARPAGARWIAMIDAVHADADEVPETVTAARSVSLSALWNEVGSWWADLAGDSVDARMVLDAVAAEAEALLADDALAGHTGHIATRLLVDATGAARLPHGRFGAGLYIGTLESAIGLDFDAVRVLGLSEGSVPPSPREHPLFADADRRRWGAGMPGSLDASLSRTQALERAVRAAHVRVTLSAPLTGADRGQRAPGTIFVDAATAVRRAMPDGSVPRVADARVLENAWFGPALTGPAAAPTARQRARAAATHDAPPADWNDGSAWDADAAARLARGGEPLVVAASLRSEQAAGLTAVRALSATAAQSLLSCPRAFLFQRVLGWKEPDPPQSPYAPSPMEYGTLLHRVLERFGLQHGEAFGARRDTVTVWVTRAQALAAEVLQEFLRDRSLRGASVRAALETRLLADVRQLIRYDWNGGAPRTYVGSELPFGETEPLQLSTRTGGLFVRGRIDRLDVENGTTFLRDFKSGRARLRDADEFDPVYDLQLGVYLLVLDRMADRWGVPASAIAAFVYPGHGADQERAFRADATALARFTEEWLALCAALLEGREFPQSPVREMCERCAFRRVCGDSAPARAVAALATTQARASAAFAALWVGDGGADEEEA